MNRLGLSVLSLAGLAAVARAEPPADASRAVEADLARARAALARGDTPAVLAALDEAMRHVSDADAASLRALIAFEDRFRDALAGDADGPAASSPPASPEPAPAPPVSTRASEPSASAAPPPSPPPEPRSELGAVLPPPPAPPSQPLAKTDLARPRVAPMPERGAWPQRLAPPTRQPHRPAPGAEPWRDEEHREALGTAAPPGPGPAPEPLSRTAPRPAALQAGGPGAAQRQPGPGGGAGDGSGLRLLGHYAQDESGRWVWLPAGAEDAPPAPPGAAPPPQPR
jgi:hypothetical protein